jgi:hypothetical protein
MQLHSDGRVSFQITALAGRIYSIQASTNLVDWVSLSTNTATGGFLDWEDTNTARYVHRFYRARSGP